MTSWADMLSVTQTIKDREMQCLAQITARINETQERLNALEERKGHEMHASAPYLAGTGDRYFMWQGLVRLQRQEILRELAKLFAEREAQIVITRKAVGRADAIAKLIESEKPRKAF